MTNYYNYEELRAKALEGNQDDINALGEWFNEHGLDYWNGERFDADGFSLYPVYEEVGEDEYELKGYELRWI